MIYHRVKLRPINLRDVGSQNQLAGQLAGRWFSGCFPFFRLEDEIRYGHTKLLRRRDLLASMFQLVFDNCFI